MSKENIKRWCRTYNGWLFAANLVFAIINLIVVMHCLSPCSSKVCGFGYWDVIISIFSLLVTVLVGWNVFSVIDFKVKMERIDKRSKQIDKISKEIGEMDDRLKKFEQEYYDRIKKVESSFIETSFDIYHAKPDETIMVIVIHGLEVVLWLAQMGDFDKACEVLRLVYIGINKRKPFTIPAGYAKNFNILVVRLSRYAMIAKTVEYNDLRDRCKISWDDLNRFNKYNNNE